MKAFVDTNVLVYAYDRGAGAKHERALSLVENLWKEGNGVLSAQVLQEFYVNVRRKAQKPISHDQVRALITDYLLTKAFNILTEPGCQFRFRERSFSKT